MNSPRIRVPHPLPRIADTPKVRAALMDLARAIDARAKQLAGDARYEVNTELIEETRDDGRPSVRILSRDADQEFGTYGKRRLRILGRAADIRE